MARCPFAKWEPLAGTTTGGSYTSGPFKIVHHTTEGNRYEDARNAYIGKNAPPHFTVDSTTIHQHIDTSEAARALKNLNGGVQTNRDSAIQIEVVGFAGKPKDRQTLTQVARLCRWIEQTHEVPQEWPNGLPRSSSNGRDPGGHNRNPVNWDTRGGHYGHSHVPENDHWDPGYTEEEVALILGSAGDINGGNHDANATAPGDHPASHNGNGGHSVTRPELKLGEKVPNQSESASVGPFRDLVPRDSPVLVRNSNEDIVFLNDEGNDDDRFMTRRLKEKTDTLARLVMQEWAGVKLRVTDAWDEGRGHSSSSRHYEGRAVDLTTFPRDSAKLGRLCILAVDAGFDWVFYEDALHIHASVRRDEDAHDDLAGEGRVRV